MPHRTEPHSSKGRPNKCTPVEYMSPLPIPNSAPYFSGGDLPIMRPTPAVVKTAQEPTRTPDPIPTTTTLLRSPAARNHFRPSQAKYLTVTPPDPDEEEEAVLRARVPRTKGSNPKGKPQNMNIIVVPASHPIVLATAHTPAAPPPISAVFPGTVTLTSCRSAPGVGKCPEAVSTSSSLPSRNAVSGLLATNNLVSSPFSLSFPITFHSIDTLISTQFRTLRLGVTFPFHILESTLPLPDHRPISRTYRPGTTPYFTGTPYSPEQSPYIDPGLSKGIPRALGMQAFPIRAKRPWQHGG
ncbi:hypothetical protein B0H14DRAFT_3875913 [Mycena olivaceomarginata]|nr:hypothetical protein B0H14DRAFT_3875913 [Mycena olivaceomarginata]